jgi:acetyltransferase-like isoleucine patch superfamily enzyme
MTKNIFIHDSAQVSDKAQLGEGCKIWNLVQIRENSSLGTDCIVSKNVYIDFEVNIGSRVKIQNNVSVYNGVTIEDEVFVGPNATFTNDFRPRAVADDWQVTPTLIEKGAALGANCTIICGTTIGRYAMVAAGSVVTQSVAPHILVAGNPAKPVAYIYKDGSKVMPEHVIGVENNDVMYQHPQNGEVLRIDKAHLKLLPR